MGLSGFGFGHAYCCKPECQTKKYGKQCIFDKKTHYKPSYLDLQCFHKNLVCSTTLKKLVFHPEFLKVTISDLNLDTPTVAKKNVRQKFKNKCIANNVDPDETARHEPFHLDLHCLHRYQF